MSLFQKSVLKKYFNDLQPDVIHGAYQKLQGFFQNPVKQQNILSSKEEQYQEGFLRELFGSVLGYTLNPEPSFNLITEQKNEKDSKKADGAILSGGMVKAVIELKSTKTVDLSSVEEQAFGYKNNQKGCEYVVTSNFQKLRFYISNAVEHEEFDLFNLDIERFKLLWVCLSQEYLLKDIPLKIKEASNHEEENVTKKLYADYATFRKGLFQDVCEKNPNFNRILLFKKSQKLLDRFLFLFFAEDRGLVSPNWTRRILKDWTELKDRFDNYIPLYNRFRKNFDYLNTGYRGSDFEVFAYNGGLFQPDEVLDALIIDDDLLYKGSLKLSNYDFDSEVDVNILGHIFEHSLNEIDELQAEKVEAAGQVTKRKKDGVFYTPRYITKYIVDQTIGTLCDEQKSKLEIIETDFEFIDAKAAKGSKKLAAKRASLNAKLDDYRRWLLDLKIIDPACGSGAFLNQALEFLIAEHKKIDELRARLLGGSIVLSDVENSILEYNLYGVDINEEAVEIAKLSLWLRTARRGRKLSSLNTNIKVGNSLIDDPAVAGEKAFDWSKEFDSVFSQGGFDVVIGNPPYGAQVTSTEKEYFNSFYSTTEYNYDTYGFFFEKSICLLKKQGFLGFITPNTFLVVENGEKLRKLLFESVTPTQLVETLDAFSDAVVETVIGIFKNEVPDYEQSIRILTKPSRTPNLPIEKYKENAVQLQQIYTSPKLIFNYRADKVELGLRNKIYNGSIPVHEVATVTTGVKPYQVGKGIPKQSRETVNSKAFTSFSKLDDTWRSVVRGTQVTRYNLLDTLEYIQYGPWLAEARNPELFEGEKLFVRRTDDKLLVALDSGNTVCINSAHVIKLKGHDGFSHKYLLALLNSKAINWVFRFDNFHMVNKPLAEVKVVFVERLPFKRSHKSVEFEQKVDSIMVLNSSLYNLGSSFLRLLLGKYENLTVNSKLQNWFLISWAEFLKEIEKQKVKLSLPEQSEWLHYFEEQKAKVITIKTQIHQTDKEIDQMVYELYELTEEEIKIVEGLDS